MCKNVYFKIEIPFSFTFILFYFILCFLFHSFTVAAVKFGKYVIVLIPRSFRFDEELHRKANGLNLNWFLEAAEA